MARGTPLTPEQIATCAEAYARTGSYSEAARAIGAADPSVARKALLRLGNPNRSQIYARACERRLRVAERATSQAVGAIARLLDLTVPGKPAQPPSDPELAQYPGMPGAAPPQKGPTDAIQVAALVRALCQATTTLTGAAERHDRKATSRLGREKTRLEIELLRAKLAGTLPPDRIALTDERAIEQRIAELLGDTPEGAGASQGAQPGPADRADSPAGSAGDPPAKPR